MNIEKEIQDSLEYHKYLVDKIIDKYNFNHHSKVDLGHLNRYVEKLNWINGIGKIYHETETYAFTRQPNLGLHPLSREDYFKKKEWNKTFYLR